MRKSLMLIIFGLQCLDIVIGRIVDDFEESTKPFSKYTVGELLSLDIPKKTSDDLYMDPCKAGRFVGDIALAKEDYQKVIFKDESYLKHIENYKEEILEGLQIEEEGLSSVLREKNKHSNIVSNDPLDITNLEDEEVINKYTPTLKQTYSQRSFVFKDRKRKPSGDKKRVVDGSENSLNNTIPTGKNGYILKKTDLLEEHDTPKTKSTNSKRSSTDAQSVKSTASTFLKANAEDNIHSITHHNRVSRAATARKERVWDYGVIPYEIDGNFSGAHRALFKRAMRHWENFTCVKFVERNKDEHPNFIVFTERPCGCCSFVGKRGNGGQAISIGRNCDKFGIVVHELGHVVGFWHEHTRPDRDKHVNIIRENIMSGQEYNFNKLNEEEVNSLGLTYDHDSIMHYARNTFSKGTYLDTIQPVDIPGKKRPEIGQRIRLSAGDIAQTNLLYKCTKCGRTYQGNYGVFSSPSYIQQSGTEVEKCEWRITANHGEKIVLNITDVDIEKSKDCTTDYIEIRDGYWHNSMKLGRFCGSGRPASITSTSSRILITYVNNDPIGHKGFVATYEVTCGGELSVETEVHLESPNFPDEYQPNKECVWRITVPKDYQVAIKFQSFEVENHDNCVYDYLEVKDDALQEVIGVYCGYKIPLDVISSSNSLLIKFVSDASVQKGGFSATIMKKYDECNRTDHGCEQECINKLGGYTCSCRIGYELHSDGKHCEVACGGIFNSSEGTITSPSFPELYPVNKVCIWEILTQEHYRITVNFTHFDLEGNDMHPSQYQQCDYDNIEVLSKLGDGTSKKHGLFCGSKAPNPITSEGNVIRIIFRSDTSVQKTGFAAIYSTGKDECSFNNGGCQHKCIYTFGTYLCTCFDGFKIHGNGLDCKEDCKNEITNSMGVFGSPNYPDYYPSKKICVWHFKTRPGHRIRISFLTFEVEAHPDCYYDHVDFYDGASTGAFTLGRFCGSKLPQLIVGSGNHLYMTFKSDSSVQRKGFWATHATVCGGILQATADKKHIYSHAKFGSTNYDNKADCDWTIQAPADYSVQLTFLTFDLEYEANCQHDHLEIFNGLDSSSRTLGKFCGKTKPADIFSTNDALLLRFITDDTIVGKGFSLEYKAVEIEYSGEDM